jgi:predicted XRE-type DNA-binding protein
MKKEDLDRLEAAGYKPMSAGQFVGMAEEEERVLELRMAVSRGIKRMRGEAGLTQRQVASKLKTSQSRFNRIETGAPDVSLDQLFTCYFMLGGRIAGLVAADTLPRFGAGEVVVGGPVQAAEPSAVPTRAPKVAKAVGADRPSTKKAPGARKSPAPRAAAKS